jgi:dsDNA-specific endonuclease/ATPase MutS2
MTGPDIKIAVSIIDRISGFLKLSKEKKKTDFQNYIEPLFRDTEKVAENYVRIFTELEAFIKSAESTGLVKEWLLLRRGEFAILRDKLRAFLGQNEFNVKDLPKFENGIWGVLKGGVGISEEGHFQMREYGLRDHTLYDLVRKFNNQVISESREKFIETCIAQRDWVERSWLQVCDAYIEIKKDLI